MPLKVGLLVGREWSFPPAFLDEVQRRDAGVVAEYARLGGTRMNEPCPYAVIIDRISHEVPYYRSHLKNAVLQGVHVVNNPFMWSADDLFFEAALATRLGVTHPKTLVLPNKEYGPSVAAAENLRNLIYPLDWRGIVDYVGLPLVLRDAQNGGANGVVCRTLDELLYHFDRSLRRTMIVQEFIDAEQHLCCLCLGREEVLVTRYDPQQRRCSFGEDGIAAALRQRIMDDSLKLVRALGYDVDAIAWAVKGGVPYAIDVLNPAPDLEAYAQTPYFEWVVKHMADMAIRLARSPRPQAQELRWSRLF
jgi:hypothetical protein